MFFVYVIKNPREQIYIGQTSDIEMRVKRHNNELPHKTKAFTRTRGPWILVYKEKLSTRSEAIKREKELKSFRGRQFLKDILDKDK